MNSIALRRQYDHLRRVQRVLFVLPRPALPRSAHSFTSSSFVGVSSLKVPVERFLGLKDALEGATLGTLSLILLVVLVLLPTTLAFDPFCVLFAYLPAILFVLRTPHTVRERPIAVAALRRLERAGACGPARAVWRVCAQCYPAHVALPAEVAGRQRFVGEADSARASMTALRRSSQCFVAAVARRRRRHRMRARRGSGCVRHDREIGRAHV